MSDTAQYTDQKTGKKLFVLVGSSIGLFILVSLVISVGLLCWGGVNRGNSVSIDPNITFLKIMQLFATIITFLVPVFILAHISGVKSRTFVLADKGSTIGAFLLVVIMMIAIQPLMNATSVWFSDWSLPSPFSWMEQELKGMEKKNADLVSSFLNVSSIGSLIFNVLVVAVAPAICEEFFFRGGLQRLFSEKMNKHASVWLTAAIFSFVHMDVTGFLPRMMLGACFGYLLVYAGTIWLPVLAHFINNLCGVLSGYLIWNHIVDKKMETFGTGDTFWVSCIGLLLFLFLLWALLLRKNWSQSSDI